MASIDNVRIPIEFDITVNLNVVTDDDGINLNDGSWDIVGTYDLANKLDRSKCLYHLRTSALLVIRAEPRIDNVVVHRRR